MFGKILYISDNICYIENKITNEANDDLLNIHIILENDTQKILGEIIEVTNEKIKVNLLGEFTENHYVSGIMRKVSLNLKIRIINKEELMDIVGSESKESFILGQNATYKEFNVCPNVNELFANHLCVFGNTGSGKSCGVARIIQNILSNDKTLAYNANLVFFDSFGEYKSAFKNIDTINSYYSYKFVSNLLRDPTDVPISIPVNLLTIDDLGLLLQAEKHTQLTILQRALKFARIFASEGELANKYKNTIIAKALITVLYSAESTNKKKDEIFSIINTCHTKEFDFDTPINGVGYSRSFSECFALDSKGRFGEEVLITEYILKYAEGEVDEFIELEEAVFTLADLEKALAFTMISEGFNQNKNLYDDAQILKVRLNTIVHHDVGKIFKGDEYVPVSEFITRLLSNNSKKAQIINISLEGIDDAYSKALVKIFSRIMFDFAKMNANRATIPFHIFLEEAHRYIQNDKDIFLLGYNIFDRIAKEGRKYGVILDIISQRPMEMSDTVISQCSNFIIFKMTHPKDIKYIEEMLPNISQDVIDKMRVLQPGSCVVFGSAFKIPMIVKLTMPYPRPYSSSCDISKYWDSLVNIAEMVGLNKDSKEVSVNTEIKEETSSGSDNSIIIDSNLVTENIGTNEDAEILSKIN